MIQMNSWSGGENTNTEVDPNLFWNLIFVFSWTISTHPYTTAMFFDVSFNHDADRCWYSKEYLGLCQSSGGQLLQKMTWIESYWQ